MKFTIEKQNPFITPLGVQAVIDFYRTIAVEHISFPGIDFFATGVSSPFLNVVIDTRLDRNKSTDLIEKAKCFFQKYSVEWGWLVTPGIEHSLMKKQGFTLMEEAPAMYFDLTHVLPEISVTSLVIENAKPDLREWIEPLIEGFGGENDDSYRLLNVNLLEKGNEKLKHFVGFYQGEVAAGITLFLSNDVVMIHNLATKKKFRHKGIGTALTLHIMAEAKWLGYQHCFLESSEDGLGIYRKLGFKAYCKNTFYEVK